MTSIKKITLRSLHRDLGYFFLGLAIAFSISGLFLNHRQTWHPLNYEYESKTISLGDKWRSTEFTEENITSFATSLGIEDKLKRFGLEENIIWARFENSDIEIDLENNEVDIKKFMVTPVLGQMTLLHIDTSTLWIYYSDLFALGMLTIAISAMFFQNGNYSFKNYGWKLSLLGLLFPTLFLLIDFLK